MTFDRPMQVSTFTPGQVLQIMGPTGSISGPQIFSEGSVDQQFPTQPARQCPATLSSTLTVPDYNGTFTVGDVTLALDITDSAGFESECRVDRAQRNPGRAVLKRRRLGAELHSHGIRRRGGDVDHQWDSAFYRVVSAHR